MDFEAAALVVGKFFCPAASASDGSDFEHVADVYVAGVAVVDDVAVVAAAAVVVVGIG